MTFPALDAVAPEATDHRLRAGRRRDRADSGFARFGRCVLLAAATAAALRRPSVWVGATAAEARRQAFDALGLVLLLSTLGGALIALQTGYQFQGNLPAWVIGSIVSSSLVTEVTPLFVGLGLIGMIGTRIAAELAAMQITEQIDAMELMGRDPVVYLVVPRVVAATLVGPVLMGLALAASMIAGWIGAITATHASTQDFWFGVRYYMRDFPPFFALIKGFAFGAAIAFVACFAGLEARGGSAGVGRTVKGAVVAMLIALVVLDTLIAPLLKIIRI
jgi:phospholipid/cholesterol/gamma-HCH transport system permease protein